MVIKNAIIESISIDDGGRGLLTAWLHLDYGGLNQGFGGFSLYLSESYKHHDSAMQKNYAGHFLYRCMEIGGVSDWSKLVGKSIRVKCDKDGFGGRIIAIGHIIKDDWFCPEEDFKTE